MAHDRRLSGGLWQSHFIAVTRNRVVRFSFAELEMVMNNLTKFDHVFAGPCKPQTIWERLTSAVQTFRARAAARDAVAGLASYDDRMLADIGLTRSDVTSALANAHREDASLRLARIRRERSKARFDDLGSSVR